MVPPVSGNQMQKLGKRLAQNGPVAPADQILLRQVLGQYQDALIEAHSVTEEVVTDFNDRRGLSLSLTARLKNTETIREKIRRDSTNLARMDDVAGLRIVDPRRMLTRLGQDDLYRRLVQAFGASRVVSRVDRRSDPRSGYRALHLIVNCSGLRVEVQIRTSLQDVWAQTFEKLADRWGREVRYGKPVRDPDRRVGDDITRGEAVEFMAALSAEINDLEQLRSRIEGLDLQYELGAETEGASEIERLDLAREWRADLEKAKSDLGRAQESMHDTIARLAAVADEGVGP